MIKGQDKRKEEEEKKKEGNNRLERDKNIKENGLKNKSNKLVKKRFKSK